MIDISYSNIVIGLSIVIAVCLWIIYKYVWSGMSERHALAAPGRVSGNVSGSSVQDSANLDLFNVRKGNVGKTVKLSVEEENKIYHLVELKNNKVLIMEEYIYAPEEKDRSMRESATDVPDIHKADQYESEQSDREMDALINGRNDVDDMKDILSEQNRAYMDEQQNLFDTMGNEMAPENDEHPDEEND